MTKGYHANELCPEPLQLSLTIAGAKSGAIIICPGHDSVKRWSLEELRENLLRFEAERSSVQEPAFRFLDWLEEQA